MKNNLTYFEIIETYQDIKIIAHRNDNTFRETYCLDREQAELIRGDWVNEFWGFKLN